MTKEKAENLVPEDLTTQKVAVSGAERSLLARLEAVQKQKAALEHKGYAANQEDLSKKLAKREHALPAEVQEKNDQKESPNTGSDGSWSLP